MEKEQFDYEQELERVMSYEWVLYNGCIIQPYGDKFKALNKIFDTAAQAQKHIDGAFGDLARSLMKGRQSK